MPVSLHDYLRPWKLFSLACGIAILVAGSYVQPAPDWDIPISFIMAFCTYIFAPLTARVLVRRLWPADASGPVRHVAVGGRRVLGVLGLAQSLRVGNDAGGQCARLRLPVWLVCGDLAA